MISAHLNLAEILLVPNKTDKGCFWQQTFAFGVSGFKDEAVCRAVVLHWVKLDPTVETFLQDYDSGTVQFTMARGAPASR